MKTANQNAIDAARIKLADSLSRRVPTFEVAQAILDLRIIDKRSKLHQALKGLAGESRYGWYLAMNDDFDQVDPADTQVETFAKLFPSLALQAAACDILDANSLRVLIRAGLKAVGAGRYRTAENALINFRSIDPKGEASSRKNLRKKLRFLKNFEEKVLRLEDISSLRHAQMQAKSRLAYLIDPSQCDDLTLAFCAYLAARANRRSIFMIGAQSKAFDKAVEGMFKLLKKNPTTNWVAVAHVRPTKEVFEKLSADERGHLIGVYHNQMVHAADHLAKLWPQLPLRMRDEMVMVRGVDSSRWNAYAGALNTMRSAWISAMIASGLDDAFNAYLPGKAPRLMASDLVWWYRNSGQDLHEDTRMFAACAKPWEVIHGDARQTRQEILDHADALGIDAMKTGWVGPRADLEVEEIAAEPALVHGVIISDPLLAKTLRKHGIFSAKKIKSPESVPALSRQLRADGDKVYSEVIN